MRLPSNMHLPRKRLKKISYGLVTLFLMAWPRLLPAQAVSFVPSYGAPVQLSITGVSNAAYGLALDGAGNIYIANNLSGGSVIKASLTGGTQSTVGTGLSFPYGVAVDSSGNIFIADGRNGRIVKISGGMQSNVVTGLDTPGALALDSRGNIFVSVYDSNSTNTDVVEIKSGASTPITLATGFSDVEGLAVDASGNVYISDLYNNQVVTVPETGGTPTEFAEIDLYPQGIALDKAGNLFVAAATGLYEVPAGRGTAFKISSDTHYEGVTVDAAGNLFLGQYDVSGIAELPILGNNANLGSVNVCPASATSPSPCSSTQTLTYNVTASGTLGTPKVVTQGAANLDFTLASGSTCTGSVASGTTCTVNVTFAPKYPGSRLGAVQVVDSSGNVLATTYIGGIGHGPEVAFNGAAPVSIPAPCQGTIQATATDGLGNIYTSYDCDPAIYKYVPGAGTFSPISTVPGGATTLAVDGAGNLFPGSTDGLFEVPAGSTTAVTVTEDYHPTGIAVNSAGDVLFVEGGSQNVYRIPAGSTTPVVFATLPSAADLSGIALDAEGDIFVVDDAGQGVFKIPAGSTTAASYLPASLLPSNVTFDGGDNLYLLGSSDKVLEYAAGTTTNPIILVPSNASPASPVNPLAVDVTGNVFYGGISTGALTELPRSQAPALSFASTLVGGTSTDSPKTVSVQNIGNATLQLSAVSYPADFPEASGVATDCKASSSLATGALCTLSIDFKPTSASITGTSSLISEMVGLTDNALNATAATQNVPVSGTGSQDTVIFTINTVPTGLLVSVDGATAQAAPLKPNWQLDSTHTIAVTSPQGSNGTHYTFTSWSDGGTASHTVTASSSTPTYSATFSTSYLLTTAVSPSAAGSVSVSPASPTSDGYYAAGTPISLTATANSGYVFSTFAGTNAASTNPLAFTLNAPAIETADFLKTQSITFANPGTQVVGTPLSLTATATSGLAVTYSSSTTSSVCTVSNGASPVATFLMAGTCTITASQSGNSSYAAATSVPQTFTVNPNVPTISNIQALSIGDTSETILWTTDQPSTSLVNYGSTPAYGSSSAPNNNLVTSHSVTITGLSANTTYNFDIVSTNSTSGTRTTPNATFTTTPYVGYLAFYGVNNSGVTISWSTDVPATTVVAYGTTTALGQYSPVQSALTASHGVVLTGLSSGTTYYFQAQSTDASGNTGGSTIYSFTTTGQPTSPAPIITNVLASGISMTSATITWTTDQLSTSQVNYGTTTAYGLSSPLDSTPVTSHSMTLTNLTPGATYNFEVVSANSTGTSIGTSTNYTFTTTASNTTPVISNVSSGTPTSNSVTITWTTDQPAWSLVNYGTSSAYGSATPLNTSFVTSHSVVISGLTPSTTYDFDVVSENAAALSQTSGNYTFTTPAVSTAPPPFVGYVGFYGVNNTGVTISWSTDLLADTELAYGTSATSLPAPVVESSALSNNHGVVLTTLNPGTTYYFQAVSKSAAGSVGYSATTYSFTTTGTATTPPTISNVASSPGMNSATITWTTDQPSSSQVNYGTTSSYGFSTTQDPTLVTNHSVTIMGLLAGTTYDFDVSSGSATSGNYTFGTTGTTVSEPVISNVAAASITTGTAIISWNTDQPSNSQVNYGTTTAYGSSTTPNSTLVTSHSVMLTGLNPSTTYNFDVVSGSTMSPNSSFTTQPGSGTAPIISYVAFWGATGTGVNISWSTNVPATTYVAYGATPSLGMTSPVQTALTASHGVVLSGLTPGTTYYFVAQSADANGDLGASTTYSFTTTAGAPTISNVSVSPHTGNAAIISWTTSTPAYSYVQYGQASGNYTRYSAQTSLTTTPVCSLGFVPSGSVYYQLVSTDANGNQVVSPEMTFVEP